MKLAYLDFEFSGISNPELTLVSAAVRAVDGPTFKFERQFWLFQGKDRVAAQKFFAMLIKEGYTFVAYAMEAEARSLLTLFGKDRTWLKSFQAIDLYLEYRCLLNHNYKLAYGEQYLKGKVIKTTPPPPKWAREQEDDGDAHHKPEFSLAAATFKLLGEKIDTVEKNEVRALIIECDQEKLSSSLERIQKYNLSDIQYLPRLALEIWKVFSKVQTKEEWLQAALLRGDYAVRTARMIALGYPVNQGKISRFTANVQKILASAAKECLEVAPELEPFRWDKRQFKYIANEKKIRGWVERQELPYWRKTDGGQASISKDAFNDWYDSESEGFPGAFCRYQKTKQSLNGFMPAGKGKTQFRDFMGTDGRVRPYFGIYGSQSSRSQPGATGFIPLKAHWMRNFLEAPPGLALTGVDYASQEFLIAAIVSQDSAMMAAYESGDVYLAFAKAAELVPENATKTSHGKLRDAAKALVLGISYDMSATGLAPRLTRALGEPVSEDRAAELIDAFYDTYPGYADWKQETLQEYGEDGFLTLPDGWIMFGDNPNRRSVGNFPIQGLGAVVMREAVRRAQDSGLNILWTLHDALYMESVSYDTKAISSLQMAMTEAFEGVMSRYGKTLPIRLEGESWSVDYKSRKPFLPGIEFLASYVDAKGKKDLERYEPFFTLPNSIKDNAQWPSKESPVLGSTSSMASVSPARS